MPLNRAWIAQNIPHHGRMCLLDEVVKWDTQSIRCRSATHRLPDHPLRSRGRLGICCGIEYLAQAMAVHGALAADAANQRPGAGFLAALRDVRFHVLRLDDIQSDLICEAVVVAGDHDGALYEFALRAAAQPLVTGRATVVFDAHKVSRHRVEPP